MKKIYDIGIKKTIYGFRQIQASSEEEAKSKIQEEIDQETEEGIEFFEDKNSTEIISIDDTQTEN